MLLISSSKPAKSVFKFKNNHWRIKRLIKMDSFTYDSQRSSSFKLNQYSIRANICNILLEMGFSHEKIQIALLYTDSTNIDELTSFLTKGPQGWEHEFIRNFQAANEEELCEICSENASEHLNYLPNNEERKNQKISIKSIEKTFPIEVPEEETKSFSPICGICFEETIDLIHISDCKDHLYCKKCIKAYLEVLISESRVLKILCPGKICNVYFTDTLIQSFISPSYIIKYKKFLQRQQLLKDPFKKFCLQPDCEGYIQGSETDTHKFCNVCFYEMCFTCGKGWHEGNTCDEIQEKEYSTWAKDKNVKECPVCKYKIEKNEGCNHMKCIICMHEFFWDTLDPKPPAQYYSINREIYFYDRKHINFPIKKICNAILCILLLPLFPIFLLYYPAISLYFNLMCDEDDYLEEIHLSCVAESGFCFILFVAFWIIFAPVISIIIIISKIYMCITSICFKRSNSGDYNYLGF
ncbi:hypothetical protein SteCoe_11842 [Stentor coeruleus]|uniref:RBR-type E3 ubiquitin transferase n=1 Tax=Stentor coeruleus TaxID=5963 RepID=A0A1R2CCB1_9CILI|nr:hypothetical protein SteCoe_11842 [Stentor coeruleus]